MPKKGHSEEQILAALHQEEAGGKISDVCRKLGVSTATFYLWLKKYSGLGLNELRELRHLRDENSKLRQWRDDFNARRPHSALNDWTPNESVGEDQPTVSSPAGMIA